MLGIMNLFSMFVKSEVKENREFRLKLFLSIVQAELAQISLKNVSWFLYFWKAMRKGATSYDYIQSNSKLKFVITVDIMCQNCLRSNPISNLMSLH